MSKTSDESGIPKSIRHKRILDIAADRPNASFEQIASEVPSATTELVERVLEEYGDPAELDSGTPDDGPDPETSESSDASPSEETNSSPMDETDSTPPDETDSTPTEEVDSPPSEEVDSPTAGETDYPDPDDLPAKQRKTLRAIADHPEATQRELAEMLGVTAPTVGNRANAIEGFDWDDREAFAKAVFDAESTPDVDDSESAPKRADREPNSNGNARANGRGDESVTETGDAEPTSETGDAEPTSETGDAESATGGGDPDSSPEAEDLDQMATEQTELSTAIDQLAERLTNIERRLDEMDDANESSSAFTDPELAHKVVHGCMKSDAITEEEELRILAELLGE